MSQQYILTLDHLKSTGPCKSQFVVVCRQWPDGIPITEESIHKARELCLDVWWIMTFCIKDNIHRQFNNRMNRDFVDRRQAVKRDYYPSPAWEKERDKADQAHREWVDKEFIATLTNPANWKYGFLTPVAEQEKV